MEKSGKRDGEKRGKEREREGKKEKLFPAAMGNPANRMERRDQRKIS